MTNKARGEVDLVLGEETYPVAMGLGTLAELETAFGVESFEDALALLFSGEKLSAGRMLTFVRCVMKGSGVALPKGLDADLLKMSPEQFSDFATRLLLASGITSDGPAPTGKPAARPLGGKKGGRSG